MSPSRKSFKVSHPNPRKVRAGRGAFSSRLKKLESRVGQKNLSKILGVSPRSIRRYKDGTRTPRADIRFKVGRMEKAAKGLRRTKSIKRKKLRAEKIIKAHPEVAYFETRKSFEYAETDHIDLVDIRISDIDALILYLIDEGCDMAYFLIGGVDRTGIERYYSSELMLIEDFAEEWKEILAGLMMQYEMTVKRIDLIGIKHNAPSPQKG
jgi:hypothetical protein